MPLSAVTGAAGFVGKAIVRRLLAAGEPIRAIILPGDPLAGEIREIDGGSGRVEIATADVTRYDSIAAAFEGVERVFHTAAMVHGWAPWDVYRAVNVGGMQNVARAAREKGVGRLVAVSTTDVFGIPRADEVLDETSPYGTWNEPYPDTKIEAEKWLWQFHRESGLPVSVIYPGWVYGPGDRALFPSLAEAIAGGIMFFWSRGVTLDWVHVDNLADACVLAGTHSDAVGQGYIVHDDAGGPTLEEVCGRIADAIGVKRPSLHVPYAVAIGAAAVAQSMWRTFHLRGEPLLRTVDVKAFGRQWHLSSAKIRRDLGWTPRVGIEEGMNAAIEAVRTRRVKAKA